MSDPNGLQLLNVPPPTQTTTMQGMSSGGNSGPGNSCVEEAPFTGEQYARYNGSWQIVKRAETPNPILVWVGPNPPPNTEEIPLINGRGWFDTDNGKTYIYYDDGSSQQWVENAGFYYVDDPISVLAAQNAATAAQGYATAAAASAAAAAASATAAANSATASAASANASLGYAQDASEFAAAADVAADRAEAALATIVASGTIPLDPLTYTAPLLQGHTQGLMIDGTIANRALAVQVKDPVTPANTFLGKTLGFGNITYISPKLCMQADGSYKYQNHNDVVWAEDFTQALWTKTNIGAPPAANVTGPDGVTNDLTTFTVTGAALPVVTQNVTVRANEYRTEEFTIKQGGTSPFITVSVTDNAVTKRASVNMTTLALGTIDAGITAVLSNTDEKGVVYPATATVRTVLLTYKSVATTNVIRVAPSDTDHAGGTNSTIGRTFFAGRAANYRGAKRLKYMKTVATNVRDEPLDWTHGSQMIRNDVQQTYAIRSADDLTNGTFWIASGLTPALDAIGPHNEPCSSLTVVTPGGTILQAVTSSGTVQNFHACLRRRTGVGTWEMTKDNGATWTDVTALIAPAGATKWGRAFVRGALANPNVGFRGNTPGDVIEVSMANVSKTWQLPPPYPSALIDYTTSLDAFNIPNTKYNAASSVLTLYMDIYIPSDAVGSAGARSRVGFLGAALAPMSTVDTNVLATNIRLEHTSNDGTLRTQNFGTAQAGRIQIQMRIKPTDYAATNDGNAPWWNPLPGTVVHTGVGVTLAQSMWFGRMLVVPEDINSDNDDLRYFKLDKEAINVNKPLLATASVAKGVPGSGGHLRIPAMTKLYEQGDVCRFQTIWGQKNPIGYNAEHPQRMMARTWEYNKATKLLTPITGEVVWYQTPGWDTGVAATTWGVQGYTGLKIEYGPYIGRELMTFAQQDQPGGTPDNRNMYSMISDTNGPPWSAKTMIIDTDTFLGPGFGGFVANGENSTIFQLKRGPHAGRVYASFNMNNAQHGVMWCDDFKEGGDGSGTHWSVTPPNGGPGIGRVLNSGYAFGTLTEPAVTYWLDDTIILVFRNSGGGDIAWSKSTDYGMNFTLPILCAGDSLAWNVNMGLIQDDPNGNYGRYGRLIGARSTLNGRTGHKIQQSLDGNLTWETIYRLYSEYRFIGYCPLLKLFNDSTIKACMAEHQPTGLTNTDTSQILAIFDV